MSLDNRILDFSAGDNFAETLDRFSEDRALVLLKFQPSTPRG